MVGAISTSLWCRTCISNSPTNFPRKSSTPNTAILPFYKTQFFSSISTFSLDFSLGNHSVAPPVLFSIKVSSSSEYKEEPATNVKFQTSLRLPGCSSSLSLLGTGYREKVFAIIGVKVYAAGLYVENSILSTLNNWKGQKAAEIQDNSAIFSSIFQAPFQKSLHIVLVHDVDGKTFWDALDDAISPRIKVPTPVDDSALSTFRSIFQDRPLKKGTFIFLTWLNPSKMLVCVSSNGMPSGVDATIESANVTSALFDVFFGNAPVSPSLKASVANVLETILN